MTQADFNPFERLDSHVKEKSKNGWDAAVLAESCYKILRQICKEPNNWKNMTEIDHEPWLNMAQTIITVFDIKEGEELRISVGDWAKNLWNILCQSRGLDFPWDELNELERFGWHAIVRHCANLIESDGPQSLPIDEAEEKVVCWARDRVDAGKHVDVV